LLEISDGVWIIQPICQILAQSRTAGDQPCPFFLLVDIGNNLLPAVVSNGPQTLMDLFRQAFLCEPKANPIRQRGGEDHNDSHKQSELCQ
jgi:hypothetical protein